MRQSLLLCLALLLGAGTYSQLTIQSGATFFIQSGATVTVQGDVSSQANIQGPGVLQMKGSALQTLNMNGFSLDNLQIDNGNNVILGGAALINTNLTFTTGKLQLSTFDLSLSNVATITGADNTKYCISNSTGRLIKNGLSTAFTFPVGFDATTYNPLTLTQNGAVDNMGVRVLQEVLQNGNAGSPFIKEIVRASWAITEGTGGGSNLNMTAQWNGTDEAPGFNRTKTGISFYDGVGWDMTNAMTAAAAGAGPYTISRNSVTNLGTFAVGTRPVLISLLASPRIILQAAFNGVDMNDQLRAAGIIPLGEPYTGLTSFVHSGSGGGETVASADLSNQAGNSVVDWLYAQLHRSSDGVVINTRAVLLQRDGDIVDINGLGAVVNHINFAGELAGSYYISLRHRNHLGVRTNGLIALSRTVTTTTNLDFTNNLGNALPAAGNNAMASLAGGAFGLWGGNAQINNNIRYIGPSNDQNALLNGCLGGIVGNTINGYNVCDLNMNGQVRYIGPQNDQNFLLNTVLLGIVGAIVNSAPF